MFYFPQWFVWRISLWSELLRSVLDLTVNICSKGFGTILASWALATEGAGWPCIKDCHLIDSSSLAAPPPFVVPSLDVWEQNSFCQHLNYRGVVWISERTWSHARKTQKLLQSQTHQIPVSGIVITSPPRWLQQTSGSVPTHSIKEAHLKYLHSRIKSFSCNVVILLSCIAKCNLVTNSELNKTSKVVAWIYEAYEYGHKRPKGKKCITNT